MKHKSTLSKLFGLFILLSFSLNAQENSRSDVGNLMMNPSEPEVQEKNQPTDAERTKRSRYRSINGTNNNLRRNRTDWGASNIVYRRELPANYGPGGAINDANKPSARAISNVLCEEPETIFTERLLSAFGYQWGQFLDHDITFSAKGTESAPIVLPDDEELFTEDISFTRSEFEMVNSQREQINFNTAYIDGSVVYGSTDERAKWLRAFKDGKLKTSAGNLMPYNTVDGELSGAIDPTAPVMDGDGGGTVRTFVAGDIRAAENTVLTSLQTIFVREHNRLCDVLVRRGYRNDERIYQEARKTVGALIQSITYNEYLPSLGLKLDRYRGYRSRVRADLLNTFSTAAYRIGHTQVSDEILLIDGDCEEVGPGEFELTEVFFNPTLFAEYPIEVWIKGATAHELYETNTLVDDVLRNFLFGDPNSPVRFGMDLAAINIQRGRDHGLPSYNDLRKYYTGRAARQFSDISSVDSVATGLRTLYRDVDNIDAWIGMLSEDLQKNTSLGKTMSAILSKQFENLRDGDYYYYVNDPFLSRRSKRRIHNTTLSDVIRRNTPLDRNSLVDNVFFLDPCLPADDPFTAKAAIENKFFENAKLTKNPVDDALNIDLNTLKQPSVIKIYSLQGTLMKVIEEDGTLDEAKINVSDYENGIYIIKIITGDRIQNMKFIKS